MQKFLNLFISGAVSGGIYAVMAAGLVLTYQTSGIFNFAHGAVAFVTAYVFYQLNHGQGMDVLPAAVLSAFVFAPLLGLALDRILLRRLATAPVYARIVGTIGLLIALPALALWTVEAFGNLVLELGLPVLSGSGTTGSAVRGIGPFPRDVYHLDFISKGVILNSDQVAVFIVALLAAIGLWLVLRHTRLGLEMRAVVDRGDLAGLRGVNAARTSSAGWVLTMILAGLGGILIAPLFQLADSQFTLIVLGSLAAVAFAGLRSIPIAFAGGLLLGILQNLIAGYGDEILPKFINELSGLRSSIPFILTVVLLFFVGRNRGGEARSVAEEKPPFDHRAGLPQWRRLLPWAIWILIFIAFTLQWLPWGWASRRRLRGGRDPGAGHGPRHRLPLVRGRHRPGRDGQPRPGHVRDRGRLHGRMGAQPRLGVRSPVHREPRPDQLRCRGDHGNARRGGRRRADRDPRTPARRARARVGVAGDRARARPDGLPKRGHQQRPDRLVLSATEAQRLRDRHVRLLPAAYPDDDAPTRLRDPDAAHREPETLEVGPRRARGTQFTGRGAHVGDRPGERRRSCCSRWPPASPASAASCSG